ncbi:MAG: pyruvate dehydrogenase complex dihydrolipoamide acetyltransferase [Ramlibacter sp.]|nr:pyruvate dehydrogenase complex dihydrolipoamide acetyltransferase [Ramlibacter sp.]
MATEIKLPALAPSMTEGNVARWSRKEGEAVSAGEIIAEIETDKALVDLEAPASGVLGRIAVPAGTDGVKVDTVIGWIVQPGEAVPTAGAAAAAPVPAPAETPAIRASADGAAQAPAPLSSTPAPAIVGRVFASPLARRLGEQAGIPLAGLRGSGPRGRIVRIDVEAAIQAARTAAPTSAAGGAAPADERGHTDIPHSNTRRVIAQRLTEAKQQVPHFYLTIDCRVDRLLALRAEANAAQDDARLSVNDFIVRAVALALKRVPAANASWTDSALRQWHEVDVSVAVATPTGLITPVVRGADRKAVAAISAEVKALAERARQGRLKPHEYQGGGFTISNLGMYGIREFAAIINPPQACILAVGAGEQRPVVADGALAVATLMTCTLSVDHRVVDGAVGAQFLAAFKKLIEQPLALLL